MIQSIVSILQCPISKSKLRLLTSEEILELNQKIDVESIYFLDGSPVMQHIENALMNESADLFYSIHDEIIALLPTLAMSFDVDTFKIDTLSVETQIIKSFYDSLGWQKNEENIFEDALQFEDLRPVMSAYIDKCHVRLKTHLPNSGDFFLDIASGPIQYDKYLAYSEEYAYRICADISILALKNAKKRLINQKGFFVLCDITNLPFLTNTCDTFVSLHTIYHVAANQQLKAFEELNRVLKKGQSGVVVYSWGQHSLLMNIFQPRIFIKNIKNYFRKPSNVLNDLKVTKDDTFFFHAHNKKWFDENLKSRFDVKIASWRSINVSVSKRLIKPWLGGNQLLSILFFFENLFPYFFGRFGKYPIFIFKKKK
jgi:ubiquinone/menaquinone biosynthesis C-methylase UbiE/uncharacterized protein YbaR (Trm112 family)